MLSLLICEAGEAGTWESGRQAKERRRKAGRESGETSGSGGQQTIGSDGRQSSVIQVAQIERQSLRVVEAGEEVVPEITCRRTVGEEGATLVPECERQSCIMREKEETVSRRQGGAGVRRCQADDACGSKRSAL